MGLPTEYNRLVEAAYQALGAAGGDPRQLSEPFRTVVLVDTAKGVIDNGGIKYFFEADFPFNPEYSVFSSALRNIGLTEAANDIDRAVARFPFANAHLHAGKRIEFIANLEPDPSGEFQSAGDRIMDDKLFDEKVLSYAKKLGFSAG